MRWNPSTGVLCEAVGSQNRNACLGRTTDGKKFVVLSLPTQPSADPLTLVTNWAALLRKNEARLRNQSRAV